MDIKKLGRYEILEEIGRGSMGVVYKGHDSIIDRIVAVKTVEMNMEGGAKGNALSGSFYHEARIAGKLSHPNIATIYDAGEENGVYFIVMEFVEGITLDKVIKENIHLPLSDKVRIIILIANGLHYAHQNGVIHRDIKPANIMLLEDKQIKIMDFGIARGITKDLRIGAEAGRLFGSPAYMSPEQIKGEELTRQSDIFSLGIVSYELLSGKKPFQGNDVPSILKAIINYEPPHLAAINEKIPLSLEKAVMKALEKDTGKRFKNTMDMADQLEIFLYNMEANKNQDIAPSVSGNTKNLIHILQKNYSFFSDFSFEELRQIFKLSTRSVYKKGDVIFEENTIGNRMYIIISGTVAITKTVGGEKAYVNSLKEGDCFGEMGIVDSSPRYATAAAESDCIVIAINEVILRYSAPELCLKLYKNLTSILSEKLRKADMKVQSLKRERAKT